MIELNKIPNPDDEEKVENKPKQDEVKENSEKTPEIENNSMPKKKKKFIFF
ncbi:MAG: hypothetical protein GQ557_00900 [Mycoplasmataceae bacterium]|nr:hypothetical protein [Mycoplasmataceae bacterium]